MNKDTNTKFIDDILHDLYKLDHDLKKYHNDLTRIVNTLIEAEPDIVFDNAFKERLRKELMMRAVELKQRKKNTTSLFSIFSWQRLSFGLGGTVLGMLLIALLVYYPVKTPKEVHESLFSVDKVEDYAFGSLAENQEGGAQEVGRGGGGGTGGVLPIGLKQYDYTYQGDPFTVDDSALVFKRKMGTIPQDNISALIRSMKLGIADLSVFQNLRLESVSFIGSQSFDYSVHVDFYDGSVSINQSQRVFSESQLSANDMPSNDKLIEVAEKFLDDYKINKSSYDSPEINEHWRQFSSADFVPSELQVIYPLVINGRYAYQRSGEKLGIAVSIDTNTMRVAYVSGLKTQHYEESLYEIETDNNVLIELAENGGWSYSHLRGQAETVKIELGTPENIYVQHWQQQSESGERPADLLVPALLFPANNASEWQKGVIVPLVEEIITEE